MIKKYFILEEYIITFSDEDDFIAKASVSNDAYSICYRQSSVCFMTVDDEHNDDNERNLQKDDSFICFLKREVRAYRSFVVK